MKQITKKILLGLVGLLIILSGAFFIYVSDAYKAQAYTLPEDVTVHKDKDYIITASVPQQNIGIVIYPGGKVEADAYIPLLVTLAQEGYTVIIADMPFNLAVFDINRMSGIMERNQNITQWYLVGHSLGGAMAGSYTASHDSIDGLILLGAYSTKSLSDYPGSVVQVVGTQDGIVNRESITKNDKNLPNHACRINLEGANHSQFGYYGLQSGDNPATLSFEEQSEAVVAIIRSVIIDKTCQ